MIDTTKPTVAFQLSYLTVQRPQGDHALCSGRPPASVGESEVWSGTVKRGPFVQNVTRALGWISART